MRLGQDQGVECPGAALSPAVWVHVLLLPPIAAPGLEKVTRLLTASEEQG